MKSKKLTPQQRAEVWSQINLAASRIVTNEKTQQNAAEFYKELDTLIELRKTFRWHEVASTIERGEKE